MGSRVPRPWEVSVDGQGFWSLKRLLWKFPERKPTFPEAVRLQDASSARSQQRVFRHELPHQVNESTGVTSTFEVRSLGSVDGFFSFEGPVRKANKHKEFWRDTPWFVSRLSRGHVPSVPSCPICPVICPVRPMDILPLECEFPHKSVSS